MLLQAKGSCSRIRVREVTGRDPFPSCEGLDFDIPEGVGIHND